VENTDQLGTKFLMGKLCGNMKFDTDTKMTCKQFFKLVMHLVDDNEENDEAFDKFVTFFEKSAEEGEEQPPVPNDPENEDLILIQDKFRSFVPPVPKEEGEGEAPKEE
jgi:hypothetical protein